MNINRKKYGWIIFSLCFFTIMNDVFATTSAQEETIIEFSSESIFTLSNDSDHNTKKKTLKKAINTSPSEGNYNHSNYFKLSISKPLHRDVSVSYQTQDGTAKAGKDYIATSGVATILAGETSTLIEVIILADYKQEGNETFHLIITNPKGAIFPDNIDKIIATHTIINTPRTVPTPTPLILQDAFFIDAPVANISYSTFPSGQTGKTDEEGRFKYSVNIDTHVFFSIGKLILGKFQLVSANRYSGTSKTHKNQTIVTPFEIIKPSEVFDTDNVLSGDLDNSAAKLASLLQSFDSDGDHSNGIQIDNDDHIALNRLQENHTIDLSTPLDKDNKAIIKVLDELPNFTLKDVNQASKELNDSVGSAQESEEGNHRPFVRINESYITLGKNQEIDWIYATGSDEDGDALTYKWELPDDFSVNGGLDKNNITFTSPNVTEDKDYQLRVTVSDGKGEKYTSSLLVKVKPINIVLSVSQDELSFNNTDPYIITILNNDGNNIEIPLKVMAMKNNSVIRGDYIFALPADLSLKGDRNPYDSEATVIFKQRSPKDYTITVKVVDAYTSLQIRKKIIIRILNDSEPLRISTRILNPSQIAESIYDGIIKSGESFGVKAIIDHLPEGDQITEYSWRVRMLSSALTPDIYRVLTPDIKDDTQIFNFPTLATNELPTFEGKIPSALIGDHDFRIDLTVKSLTGSQELSLWMVLQQGPIFDMNISTHEVGRNTDFSLEAITNKEGDTYEWIIPDELDALVDVEEFQNKTLSFTAPDVEGEYELTLKATDARGGESIITIPIKIVNSSPSLKLKIDGEEDSNFIIERSLNLSNQVKKLTLTAIGEDENGDDISYEWNLPAELDTEIKNDGKIVEITIPTEMDSSSQDYDISLSATTDIAGETPAFLSITLQIKSDVSPPDIGVKSKYVFFDSTVIMDADATDADPEDSIVEYHWVLGNGLTTVEQEGTGVDKQKIAVKIPSNSEDEASYSLELTVKNNRGIETKKEIQLIASSPEKIINITQTPHEFIINLALYEWADKYDICLSLNESPVDVTEYKEKYSCSSTSDSFSKTEESALKIMFEQLEENREYNLVIIPIPNEHKYTSSVVFNRVIKTSYRKPNDTGVITSLKKQPENKEDADRADEESVNSCTSDYSKNQDCATGRDTSSNTNSDTDGFKGFSFTKIGETGLPLVEPLDHLGDSKCILDNVTGLMWEAKVEGNRLTIYSRESANSYANEANSNSLCGHDDWRLPTVPELISIINFRKNKDDLSFRTHYSEIEHYIFLQGNGGNVYDSGEYWSSNKQKYSINSDIYSSLTVDTSKGVTRYYNDSETYSFRVRLVRGDSLDQGSFTSDDTSGYN